MFFGVGSVSVRCPLDGGWGGKPLVNRWFSENHLSAGGFQKTTCQHVLFRIWTLGVESSRFDDQNCNLRLGFKDNECHMFFGVRSVSVRCPLDGGWGGKPPVNRWFSENHLSAGGFQKSTCQQVLFRIWALGVES